MVVEPNECKMVGHIDIKGMDVVKRVYSPEGISPTVSTCQGGYREPKIYLRYRIRKITPKECWRLMGFDDEDFDKAQNAGISNSQLYKEAGNSIVVNVLECIFTKLLIQHIEMLEQAE